MATRHLRGGEDQDQAEARPGGPDTRRRHPRRLNGGRFFTNYVAHPTQGALLGFVWVQNDPKGKAARVGRAKAYWRSCAKAFAWSAVWSTQFELGPVSMEVS